MKSLEELNWEQFHIGDVFSVERPVARNKDNYEHGDVPFVASGAANNGVLKCCRPKNDETLDKRNCITVSPAWWCRILCVAITQSSKRAFKWAIRFTHDFSNMFKIYIWTYGKQGKHKKRNYTIAHLSRSQPGLSVYGRLC